MTRIFNFIILFALAGIFYVQTDGFGANKVSAGIQPTTAKQAEPVVQKVVAKVVDAPATQTLPQLPIASNDVNALSAQEKEAIKAQFVAKRLTSSTVIRSVKLTKAPVNIDAALSTAPDGIENMIVSGNVVNARAKPTTSSKVLAKLRKGTEVVSTGQSDGPWAEVIVVKTGQSVWMHSSFLSEQG